MYRRSLTHLVRSHLILRRLPYPKTFLPHLCRTYMFALQPIPSVRVPRCYFCDSINQDGILSTQTSHVADDMEDKKLSDILAMENVLELLEAYSNYNDKVHENRIAVFRRISYIVQENDAHKSNLKADIDEASKGKRSLFLDLLNHILDHISKSSSSELATVIWSLGKMRPFLYENCPLAQACEQEILSRDIAGFSAKDITKILVGLASLVMKKSKVFIDIQNAIISGKIKISDFENQGLVGSLWSFSQTRNGSLDLFELYSMDICLRGVSTFKDFELFQLAFSFAKKGIKADELFSHTEQKVLQMGIDSLSHADIFFILWTFAQRRPGKSPDKVFRHLDRELACTNHDMKSFKIGSLSSILWCFSKAGKHYAKVYDVIKEELLLRNPITFRKDLHQLLWSFAVAEKEYGDLYEKLVLEFLSIDYRDVSKFKNLCQCAWSLGKLGITNEKVYEKIETTILGHHASQLKYQYFDIQRLLAGFAHAKKGSKELFEFLEAAILKVDVSSLKAREICNVLWPFAEMGFKTSRLFDVVEQEILTRGKLHFKEGQLARMKTSFEAFGQGSQELNNLFNHR